MLQANHFTFSELIVTDTNLPNLPTKMSHVENLCVLADFLNVIRDEFGHAIVVNSAYRTKDVNAAVKGSANSLHMQGRAADIRPASNQTISKCKDEANLQRLKDVISSHRDALTEFLVYPNFIHIAI